MANRHLLTVEEQIRGVRAAIASPKTPPQLRKALKERLVVLQKLRHTSDELTRDKPSRRPMLLDLLGL